MKDFELTDANMVAGLGRAFPELQSRIDEEHAWLSDKESRYIIYELVLYKHIARLLISLPRDEAAIGKAFSYVEMLLNHSNREIWNVAAQSIIEPLCNDKTVLQAAKAFMGPAAKKECDSYLDPGKRRPPLP